MAGVQLLFDLTLVMYSYLVNLFTRSLNSLYIHIHIYILRGLEMK